MIDQRMLNRCQIESASYHLEGFLSGGGNKRASILFVGEAPGRSELQTGKPFTGKAGEQLNAYLKVLELNRSDIYMTSTVRSRPYKYDQKSLLKPIEKRANRKPLTHEIIAHAPILDATIRSVKPKIIVTLGAVALKRLIGKELKISDIHGQPFCTRILERSSKSIPSLERGMNWHLLFPTFHPASILYNPSLKQTIMGDMQRLKSLVDYEKAHQPYFR